MVSVLLQSLVLGFVITAVPGTVFLETVRRTLADRKSVVTFLVGNLLGVAVTVSLVAAGFATMAGGKTISSVFYVASGLVLILIGLISIGSKPELRKKRTAKISLVRYELSAFLSGFVLATVNPASVAFWIVMVGRYASQNSSYMGVIANVVSINIGALVCYAVLIGLVGRYKTKLSNRHLVWLSRSFGAMIVMYGVVSLVKGYS